MKAKMSKAPLIAEGKPRGAKAPVTKPPRQPLVNEAKPGGKPPTFSAPRKGDDYNPAACGFMKVK